MKQDLKLADGRLVEISGTDFKVRDVTPVIRIYPLDQLIQNMGLSQADVALRCGLSHSTVNRACNGAIPHAANLKRLADTLSLPVQDVVKAIQNANPTTKEN